MLTRPGIQHVLFLLALEDKLFQCPAGKVKPIGRCLDAGTGTGDWAMAFGKRSVFSITPDLTEHAADDHSDCEVYKLELCVMNSTNHAGHWDRHLTHTAQLRPSQPHLPGR